MSMSKNTAPGICAEPEFGRADPPGWRQMPGRVDHAEIGVAELGRELGCRDRSSGEAIAGSDLGSSVGERDAHAAVELALLLDSGHRRAADFAGARDMRAPAGLQIQALDRDEPDAACSHRRLHRHGLDQARIGLAAPRR